MLVVGFVFVFLPVLFSYVILLFTALVYLKHFKSR